MNNVIKQLHDEAVIYTVSLCGQEHSDSPRPFQEVLDEKFAQLIIEECVKVAIHKDDGMVATADVAGYMAAGRTKAARLIKQHFGVEE